MKGTTIQSIRGMRDWTDSDAAFLHRAEQLAVNLFQRSGYDFVCLPVLEKVQLFSRAIGEGTDIVEKEMYCFTDRNQEDICLRPEGTAGLMRAVIENSWWQVGQVKKFQYFGPMFRRERPQRGRYRQFYQFGAEVIGSDQLVVDLEILQLTSRLFHELQLSDHLKLQINSLGKPEDRHRYKQALQDYLRPYYDDLDPSSQARFNTNPMRILDSKVEETQKLLLDAPQLENYLCDTSQKTYDGLREGLTRLGISFIHSPHLVRGLDYYNDMVFEWSCDSLGSQSAVCGGGRYDGLMSELGGKSAHACGFAIGVDRLQAILGILEPNRSRQPADIYVICQKEFYIDALALADKIRQSFSDKIVCCDSSLGSFKSQFRRADSSGAVLAIVFAEEEFEQQKVIIKHLRDKEKNQQLVPLVDVESVLHSTMIEL